ncbi:MAG: TonB-dependent receptor [Pseudomonadota bacterium]
MSARLTNPSGWCRLPLAAAISLTLAMGANAQEEATAGDTATLDDLTVTGSRLKRSEIEGPTPVLVLERAEFEEMGYRTVQDVLDSLTQNTGGSLSQQFVFGFTPGASGVNLRGFGTGRTLILVDGRRLPVYPLGLGGTTQFYDTSSIPTAIIQRIEVLTDGASAIYGSDAVGGVINIITRNEFDGISTRLRTGDTDDGGYQTEQIELVGGKAFDDTSVYFTMQYDGNEALMSSQRSFAESDIADPLGRGVFSTFGANIVELFNGVTVTPDPNCGTAQGAIGTEGIPPGTEGGGQFFGQNTCGFNRTQFRQLFPENRRFTFSGRIEHALSENLTAYANVRWNRGDTFVQIEPFAYSGTALFGGASANPVTPNNGGLFTGPNGGPAVYIRRLFEYGPRTTDIETQTYGGLFGLTGTFGDGWDWEAAYSLNKQDFFSQRGGSIILSAFEAQVDNGLDLFQPIPDNIVASTSFRPFTDAESKNRFADFQISGYAPWELPGGPIAVAGVLEWEDQEFFDRRDPITLAGDASDGGSAGGGQRDRIAVGAEIALPITSQIELQLAGRFDDYDDDSETGSANTGKASIQYRPLDSLLLRASFGTTFRAPDLQRLFGSTTRAFTSVVDSPLCVAAGGDPNAPGGLDPNNSNDPCDVVQSVRILVGANQALEEEEGESINAGVVWEATDDLSFTVDYYDVELENIIAAPTGQFILNQCAGVSTGSPDQSFCALVTRDAAGTLNGGQITAQALNLSTQSIRGIDATIRYALDTNDFGRFDFQFETTWVDSLKTQFAEGQPEVENLALASLPEFRHNLTVNWAYEDFGATLRTSYIDELPGINAFTDPDTGQVPDAQFIDDYIVVNGSFRYDWANIGNFQIGINNLFNEDPPTDPTNANWPWFINAGGYYNSFGREWYVQWEKRW